MAQNGQRFIEEELKKINLTPTPDTIQCLLEYYNLNDKKELYRQAGKKYIDLSDIARKIFKPKQQNLLKKFVTLQFGSSDNKKIKVESAHEKVDRKKTFRLTDETSGKTFKLANCCLPIPGDDVFGFVDDDEVVMVHKRQCPEGLKLKASHGERIVTAEWAMHKELSFAVTLEMNGIDRLGILREISRVITDEYSVNIQSINIETKDGIFYGRLHVFVFGTEEVNNLCMKLLKIKGMSSVKRVESNPI